jgi:hypothetical protein
VQHLIASTPRPAVTMDSLLEEDTNAAGGDEVSEAALESALTACRFHRCAEGLDMLLRLPLPQGQPSG